MDTSAEDTRSGHDIHNRHAPSDEGRQTALDRPRLRRRRVLLHSFIIADHTTSVAFRHKARHLATAGNNEQALNIRVQLGKYFHRNRKPMDAAAAFLQGGKDAANIHEPGLAAVLIRRAAANLVEAGFAKDAAEALLKAVRCDITANRIHSADRTYVRYVALKRSLPQSERLELKSVESKITSSVFKKLRARHLRRKPACDTVLL